MGNYKKFMVLIGMVFSIHASGQNTDVSLFLKKHKNNYLNEIESKSGNMFTKLGHHGPATENPWYALRIYFNKKMAIDVYSKAKPGLELKETKWYPTKDQQRDGWGADYYKVGSSLGLGGIRLWDGEKGVPLHPVTLRTAKVKNLENKAMMEVLSEGVPYKGSTVDVLVKVTVFGDDRMSIVEASTVDGSEVQFVTGINYHKNVQLKKGEGWMATWGIHPEDVALEKVEVGAAVIYDKNKFVDQQDDGKQLLLISNNSSSIKIGISTCNARENAMNTLVAFEEHLNALDLP